MINTLIAILVELFPDKLSPEEGKSLAEKFRNATLPSDYNTAARQVKEWLEEVRKGE
jgi:hypothetical protein